MTSVAPREDRTTLGIALMAVGASLFIGIDTSAKWLALAGLAPLQIVFMRYAGHLALALVLFAPREGAGVWRSASPGLQAMRAACLLASTLLNFTALRYLPITLTTAIQFASPVLVTLLAVPMLGERVGLHRLGAVAAGFAGVLVVVQPWGADFHPAMLLSLGALLAGALYMLLTRRLAGVDSNGTAQIWASGFATVALAPPAIMAWVSPADLTGIMVLAGIGIIGGLSHIGVTAAHRLAEASVLAPVIYVQIPVAALSGILVFDTWPTRWTVVGGGIIVAASLYIWHREQSQRR